VDDTTGEMRRKVLKGVDANAHLSELSTERQLHKRYVEQDAESAVLGAGAVYLENAREHKKEEATSAEAHEPAKEKSTKKRFGRHHRRSTFQALRQK
jgi:hypothetical protein